MYRQSKRHTFWYTTKLCCVMGTASLWIESRIFHAWKITRNSTAGKQFWTLDLSCFLNLSEMLFYLKLPWIGNISLKFKKQDKSNVQNCFPAVEFRVIFQAWKILLSIHKDAVPITQQSLVVYQNVCRFDCRYVGRTFLSLKERFTHHISKSIRNKEKPTKICLDETAKPRLL